MFFLRNFYNNFEWTEYQTKNQRINEHMTRGAAASSHYVWLHIKWNLRKKGQKEIICTDIYFKQLEYKQMNGKSIFSIVASTCNIFS